MNHSVTAAEQQPDLFEAPSSTIRVDADFSSAKRTQLNESSWIEVVPDWMSGSRALLERLIAAVPFKQYDRRLFDQVFQEPRLTASYPEISQAPEQALR